MDYISKLFVMPLNHSLFEMFGRNLVFVVLDISLDFPVAIYYNTVLNSKDAVSAER